MQMVFRVAQGHTGQDIKAVTQRLVLSCAPRNSAASCRRERLGWPFHPEPTAWIRSRHTRMKLNRGHRGILLSAGAILAGAVFLSFPQHSHFPDQPSPNGYDLLVRGAARITRPSSLKEMSSNQLAEVVATNRAALQDLRKASALPSIVPVQMSEEWIASQTTSLVNLKASAQAMDAEAYFWRLKGDYTNALALCIDQLRFSHATMRGGVLINYLVGSACEVIAVRRMTNLLSELNAGQCRQAAHFLEELESQRDSFDEIYARELEWQRRTYSVFVRLSAGFKKHVLRQTDPIGEMAGDSEKEYGLRTLECRRLLLKLAAHAYELETGERPSDVSKLIPAHLHEAPRDPSTGEALKLP